MSHQRTHWSWEPARRRSRRCLHLRRCTVVEATPEREAAAQQLLDDPGIEWHSNLAAVATRSPSPEQAFDFVIATDHFVNCDDPETHLAVLWGCVAENGLLAVIERESSPIREARSRLMSEGTPLEPSTSELLPQCFAEPLAGPPPRSTRKADAGTALKRRAQRVEKFASCVLRRGGLVEGRAPPPRDRHFHSAEARRPRRRRRARRPGRGAAADAVARAAARGGDAVQGRAAPDCWSVLAWDRQFCVVVLFTSWAVRSLLHWC